MYRLQVFRDPGPSTLLSSQSTTPSYTPSNLNKDYADTHISLYHAFDSLVEVELRHPLSRLRVQEGRLCDLRDDGARCEGV